ncbi:MAG: phosphotransferase [Pseudoxanthomonas sp.]
MESLSPTRPAAPGSVPNSLHAIDERWLTAALCASVPGAEVVRIEIDGGDAGTSARHALTIDYNAAGRAADLPTELFTKTTPDIKTRLFTGLTNLFVGEANFYTLLRGRLRIESPNGYYAAYDLRSCSSIVLMEDIARTRGARFGAPRTLKINRAMAEDMVRLMANYHSAFWESPELETMRWLSGSAEWQRHLDRMINTRAMVDRGIRRAKDVFPDNLLGRMDDVWPAFQASLPLKSQGGVTLLHHDVHSKNWYVTGDGRMGLYDWQTIVKGTWAVDFSYALNCGLDVEDRRAWIEDLLRMYLEELAVRGVESPNYDDAWLAYRQQSVHGLVFWLATIGAGTLQPDLHDREDCLVNIRRLASAVDDAGTLDVLLKR